MKRALVFLDFDMLIRHFIMSKAFEELERRYEVTYVIQFDSTTDKTTVDADVDVLKLGRVIRIEVPRTRMGSWDKLYCVTALANQRGTDNYARRRQLVADVRGWPRTRYYEFLSLPGIFPLVRRHLMRRMGTYEPLQALIVAEKPDIVIHPSILSGYFINELTQICPARGIPLVVLMNSWDNPSAKAMNTGLPDRLVVWGPQTRRHAIEYMRIPPERVLEFGAAQFDVYRQPIAESEADLRRLFKVPDGVPVVLYAGVSKGVDETAHLLELDAAIAAGRVPRCHILYRPHPWRSRLVKGERSFFDITFRQVSIDPFMEDFYRRIILAPQRAFELADYRVTAKLLRLVDGVISPLSTMLLEAAMHGVPVIMYYRAKGADEANRGIELAKALPHFGEFWGPEGIQVVGDPGALADALRLTLTAHQNPAVRAALREHSRKYVVMDGPRYAIRLADLADELTGRREAAA